MKILLLGANGQLGRDVLRYYVNHKYRFTLQAFTRVDLDLLEPDTDPSKIKVWDTMDGVFIDNLTSI